MFSTVVGTFLRFLAWYAIIIVAFGIAFYIMFHKDHAGTELNEEYPFFDTLALALFKTSAMFVGELEFADIPFTSNALSNLPLSSFAAPAASARASSFCRPLTTLQKIVSRHLLPAERGAQRGAALFRPSRAGRRAAAAIMSSSFSGASYIDARRKIL